MQSKNVLAEKAVLVDLNISALQARKYDKQVTAEIHDAKHADRDSGRYNKRLLPGEALAGITSVVNEARTYHLTHTQPWSSEGPRVLPVTLYAKYAETMRGFRQAFAAAVEQFVGLYPDYVEQAERRMNGLFKATDYPHVSQIGNKFDFDVSVMPMPTADDFRVALADDEAAAIRADVERRMEGVLKTGTQDSAARILEVVGRMSERLKGYKPATERAKAENVFRDSLVANVSDLVELLPAFNMTGDAKFDELIARMKKDLCSYDAETLRSDDNIRDAVASRADAILGTVSDFLA